MKFRTGDKLRYCGYNEWELTPDAHTQAELDHQFELGELLGYHRGEGERVALAIANSDLRSILKASYDQLEWPAPGLMVEAMSAARETLRHAI